MNHSIKMIIGCMVPFLLLFLLPQFGVTDGLTFLLFAMFMLACHLVMTGVGHGHSKQSNGAHDNDDA